LQFSNHGAWDELPMAKLCPSLYLAGRGGTGPVAFALAIIVPALLPFGPVAGQAK